MVKVKRFLKFATGDFFFNLEFQLCIVLVAFFCLPVTINFCRVSDKYKETSPVILGLVMSQNICLDLYFICKKGYFICQNFRLLKRIPGSKDKRLIYCFSISFRAECSPHLIRFLEFFLQEHKQSLYTFGIFGEKLMRKHPLRRRADIKGLPLNSLYLFYISIKEISFTVINFFYPLLVFKI